MSLIEENLQLEELDTDLYRSAKALWRPKGARGIFGGAVIAQALSAAMKTVQEGFSIHSLHSYFVLRGDELHPVLYHVERVRDGKSYATRTVQARQKNRAIFTLTCSFQKSETSSLQHQTIMPNNIPDPEDLPSDEDILLEDDSDGTGVKLPEYVRERLKNNIEVGPTDQRRIPLDYTGIPEHKRRQMYWCKAKGTITGGWPAHAMAIAYFSDSWFLSTALSVNKKSPRHVAMMASLDHSIYFHTACEADQWLLYDMESPFSGFGRGFALGRIFTRDGVLVASTVQEGLIRMKADIPKL